MKKIVTAIFLTAFFSISAISVSHAQQANKGTGIGFMVGEPTGLSLKSWTSSTNAFDVGLAWSLDSDAVHIHADYLWHNFNLFNDVQSGSLPFYYGIGGRVVFRDNNDAKIGARIPVGINYLFDDSPIGLFLELAPVFNVAPETDFDIEGGLGVRFYL
ncbi:MAG TPA: hypothetical protein VK112_00810 [Fodinibius sp.]|nr:hypothetical protein [Fodinibius sp.]